MPRENIDHPHSVTDPTARRDCVAENRLASAVVHPRTKHKSASLKGSIDCPAGKASSYFLYVLLCITAVDAKRVKLHQLARIVLIDPALAWLLLWRFWWSGLWLVGRFHRLFRRAASSRGVRRPGRRGIARLSFRAGR